MDPADSLTPPATDLPVVRVAVLSYNRRDAVRTTLTRMLRDSGYPRHRLDPVLVDNASSDGSATMVRDEFPDVRILEIGENLGAPALNRAIPGGAYDWFLILDDDCYLEHGDLERAVRAAEAHDAGLVSFLVRSPVGSGGRFNDAYVTGMLAFWGCAALVSRAAIERLGGYDPYIFIWGNELDLTLRLLDEGFCHLYLPDVVAVHMKEAPDPTAKAPGRTRDLNRRHWAYAVARLLQPADAVRVAGRLVLTAVVDAAAGDGNWRELSSLRPMISGFWDGARHRRPVRPTVSAAARDNFHSWANPVGFLRSPLERVRGGESAEGVVDRHARFRAARPDYFPRETSKLAL